MAIKDYKAAAEQIIKLSGGEENFKTVENCATRVRIQYKDINKVDIEAIKNLDGVINVVLQGALQIIVGPGACNKLCDELNRQMKLTVTEGEPVNEKKDNPLKILSDIFVPTLPAMIAAGIVQGFKNVITSIGAAQAAKAGLAATETMTAAEVWLESVHLYGLLTIFGLMYAAVFNFLGAYVGFTAAKRLKVDPVLGAMVGLITLQSNLSLLGVKAGQGGLIGVILGVILLKYVNQFFKKVIPDQVAVIFVPTFSVLVTTIALVYVLMPVAGVVSNGVVNSLLWVLDKTGIFGGFVLASLFPTLISTGLHHGLGAIHMEMLNTLGKAPLVSVQVMSNAGMVGAAVGIWLLTRKKNKKIREACEGAIPTSFLCVGEPVIYGVCLPSGFGFITGSIGAGVGGALIRLFDVAFNAMGMAGMSALPLVADGKYLYYLIAYFGGAITACVLTYIVGKARNYGAEE